MQERVHLVLFCSILLFVLFLSAFIAQSESDPLHLGAEAQDCCICRACSGVSQHPFRFSSAKGRRDQARRTKGFPAFGSTTKTSNRLTQYASTRNGPGADGSVASSSAERRPIGIAQTNRRKRPTACHSGGQYCSSRIHGLPRFCSCRCTSQFLSCGSSNVLN
jgi:hypothetical protein